MSFLESLFGKQVAKQVIDEVRDMLTEISVIPVGKVPVVLTKTSRQMEQQMGIDGTALKAKVQGNDGDWHEGVVPIPAKERKDSLRGQFTDTGRITDQAAEHVAEKIVDHGLKIAARSVHSDKDLEEAGFPELTRKEIEASIHSSEASGWDWSGDSD